MPALDAATKERISILTAAKAQGKELLPQHEQELAEYQRNGMAPGGHQPRMLGAEMAASGDMTELRDSLAVQRSERDVRRQYDEAEKVVKAFDGGPFKAWAIDALTPSPDGGFFDGLGAVVGALPRAVGALSDEAVNNFQHLQSLSNQTAINAADKLKPASNTDMTLLRMAGVSPYKTTEENMRVINAARRDGYISDLRARATADWITKNGSITNAAADGWTFEDHLTELERDPYAYALMGLHGEAASKEMDRLFKAGVPMEKFVRAAANAGFDINLEQLEDAYRRGVASFGIPKQGPTPPGIPADQYNKAMSLPKPPPRKTYRAMLGTPLIDLDGNRIE